MKIANDVYHKEYSLLLNDMKFTYIIHNCSIAMFKHLSPDIISFTSEYVKKNDASTFGIPNLVPSHNNSTGFW